MVTSFGKFCRKLRIDHNELLYDMATNLGVSSAFLSKVENGKKKPPRNWEKLLNEIYALTSEQQKELNQVIFEAINHDSIDISDMEENDRSLMLSFARKFNNIDKTKLQNFLDTEGENK